MNTKIALSVLILGTFSSFAELVFNHTFKDNAGQPLPEILIHANPINGNEEAPVSRRTDASGEITLTLADEEWFIVVDEAELLARGYFCVPGSCFSADCQPRIIFAVPLQPILSLTRSTTGAVSIIAEFDWITGLEPFLYRRYRIERSTDFLTWEHISTVLLSDPPLRLVDPKANGVNAVFYRAIEEESYQVREFTWDTSFLQPQN